MQGAGAGIGREGCAGGDAMRIGGEGVEASGETKQLQGGACMLRDTNRKAVSVQWIPQHDKGPIFAQIQDNNRKLVVPKWFPTPCLTCDSSSYGAVCVQSWGLHGTVAISVF